jgi:hypothetical protein
MKKQITSIVLLITLFSFGQKSEYKYAMQLVEDKNYAEANELFEKLLNKEFGSLTKETHYNILISVANSYEQVKNYNACYEKWAQTIAFLKENNIHEDEIEGIAEYMKSIKKEVTQGISSNSEVTKTNNTPSTNAKSQNEVTLTVSGNGKTLEEAKNNALRSAIEQAFGAYISSKTEILNDNLVKDEIVSVANGNIRKFDIISQVEIPNNGYAMTLNATVSIYKLTSFAQSKGVSIEVKGGLFAANIIQQELNEKAELISLQNILNTSNELLKKSFDYSIETKGTPTLNNGKYDIPLKITVKLNKNFYQFRKYFINSLSGLTMNESEIANYEEIKKPIGQLILRRDTISQSEMFVNKHKNIGTAWKLDIDNFDESNEKVFFYEYKNNDVSEINSKKELKSWSEDKEFDSASYLEKPSYPLYKINKNDKGYSKIFFRNPSSMILLNDYFDNIINLILNFEASNNNFELIGCKNLLQLKENISNNNFLPVFREQSFKNGFTNNFIIIEHILEYYIFYVEKKYDYFLKHYFTNLLSIFPIKKTSNTILASFSAFKVNNEITTIDFVDTNSLEEIKQLSEYKIKPKE